MRSPSTGARRALDRPGIAASRPRARSIRPATRQSPAAPTSTSGNSITVCAATPRSQRSASPWPSAPAPRRRRARPPAAPPSGPRRPSQEQREQDGRLAAGREVPAAARPEATARTPRPRRARAPAAPPSGPRRLERHEPEGPGARREQARREPGRRRSAACAKGGSAKIRPLPVGATSALRVEGGEDQAEPAGRDQEPGEVAQRHAPGRGPAARWSWRARPRPRRSASAGARGRSRGPRPTSSSLSGSRFSARRWPTGSA